MSKHTPFGDYVLRISVGNKSNRSKTYYGKKKNSHSAPKSLTHHRNGTCAPVEKKIPSK